MCCFPLSDPESQTLKEHLIDELDYVLVPTEAWNKLLNWYGCVEGQQPIVRKVSTRIITAGQCPHLLPWGHWLVLGSGVQDVPKRWNGVIWGLVSGSFVWIVVVNGGEWGCSLRMLQWVTFKHRGGSLAWDVSSNIMRAPSGRLYERKFTWGHVDIQ